MDIKEKADALVEKHQNATSLGLSKIGSAKHCILSVEHTIEVLNSAFEEQEGTTDIYPVAHAIMKQTELLSELKSRL